MNRHSSSHDTNTTSKATYSIEWGEQFRIIRGKGSLAVMAEIFSTCPVDFKLDLDLASRYEATAVLGSPDGLKTLRDTAPLRSIPVGTDVLNEQAINWLLAGERGDSSNAMFDAAFSVELASEGQQNRDHPRDADDLARCRLLVDSCTHVRTQFAAISALSPVWGRIIENWDEICAAMDAELPEWRLHGKRWPAQNTNAFIETLRNGD